MKDFTKELLIKAEHYHMLMDKMIKQSRLVREAELNSDPALEAHQAKLDSMHEMGKDMELHIKTCVSVLAHSRGDDLDPNFTLFDAFQDLLSVWRGEEPDSRNTNWGCEANFEPLDITK
jgi:hypothetical protein